MNKNDNWLWLLAIVVIGVATFVGFVPKLRGPTAGLVRPRRT